MRDYELVFIIHPDLEEAATTEAVDKVKGWITEAGGSVTKVDPWGKRKLAYPIQKQNNGQYYLFDLQVSPSFIVELERNLRFLEPVMRFLVVAVNPQ
ncbi:MAG: 30S ribosomal protein S6 [Chloroflexi bacterium]|nr:30S ribosomal protein S6 [Chloroflexota bacterium]